MMTAAAYAVHAALLLLASFRLTRLITKDNIFTPLRVRIWNRFPPFDPETGDQRTNVGYLISCPHCASVWTSTVLVTCYTINLTHTPTLYVSAVLALSAATGWLTQLDDRF